MRRGARRASAGLFSFVAEGHGDAELEAMQFVERDLTAPELDQVHLGFDAHQRLHGNILPPRTRHGFVAMDGEEFVGCATGLRDNKWYYLSDLWIADAHRGRGVGQHLLKLWERRTSIEGVVNVYTWTAGFQAPGFYEKQGWTLFAELPDYYQNGHSRLGFRKVLSAVDASRPASYLRPA